MKNHPGGSMSTSGNTTAGGYPDYTNYCTAIDHGQFEENFRCASIFDGVGAGTHLNGLTELGQRAMFHTIGRPNVYTYSKNGSFEYDTLSSCPAEYTLDHIGYSAMKYDITDMGACKFPEMRAQWNSQVPLEQAEKHDASLLCYLPAMAGPCTRGNAAGSGGEVQLGTLQTPVAVTGLGPQNLPLVAPGPANPSGTATSIFEYMTRGVQAMESFNLPVNGNVTGFVPNAVRWKMMNSAYANNADLSGVAGSNHFGGGALNGTCGPNVMMRCGFEVRSNNCIKQVGSVTVGTNTYPVYRVLWVWKPGFSSTHKLYMSMNGVQVNTPTARGDIRMSISGAAVSRAEGVVVGYIYFPN
jgi:hypothetical protein